MSSGEEDDSECVMCLQSLIKVSIVNTAFPPIMQCPEGHLFCLECHTSLGPTAQCPTCRSHIGTIRNRYLEKQRERNARKLHERAESSLRKGADSLDDERRCDKNQVPKNSPSAAICETRKILRARRTLTQTERSSPSAKMDTSPTASSCDSAWIASNSAAAPIPPGPALERRESSDRHVHGKPSSESQPSAQRFGHGGAEGSGGVATAEGVPGGAMPRPSDARSVPQGSSTQSEKREKLSGCAQVFQFKPPASVTPWEIHSHGINMNLGAQPKETRSTGGFCFNPPAVLGAPWPPRSFGGDSTAGHVSSGATHPQSSQKLDASSDMRAQDQEAAPHIAAQVHSEAQRPSLATPNKDQHNEHCPNFKWKTATKGSARKARGGHHTSDHNKRGNTQAEGSNAFVFQISEQLRHTVLADMPGASAPVQQESAQQNQAHTRAHGKEEQTNTEAAGNPAHTGAGPHHDISSTPIVQASKQFFQPVQDNATKRPACQQPAGPQVASSDSKAQDKEHKVLSQSSSVPPALHHDDRTASPLSAAQEEDGEVNMSNDWDPALAYHRRMAAKLRRCGGSARMRNKPKCCTGSGAGVHQSTRKAGDASPNERKGHAFMPPDGMSQPVKPPAPTEFVQDKTAANTAPEQGGSSPTYVGEEAEAYARLVKMAGREAVEKLFSLNKGKKPTAVLATVELKQKQKISNADDHREKGNTLFKSGDLHGALSEYDKGLKLQDSAVLRCNRAVVLRRLERYTQSLQDCQAALSLDPSYGKAALGGATSALQLGDFDTAVNLFGNYLKSSTFDSKAQLDLQKAKQLAQDVKQARELLNSKQGDRALACIKAAVQYAPKSVIIRKLQVDILLMCKRHKEVLEICDLMACVPEADMDLARARAFKATGRVEEALEMYRNFLRKDPDNEEMKKDGKLLRLMKSSKDQGNTLFSEKAFPQAFVAYTEALTLDPDNDMFNAQVLCGRGACSFKMNKLDDAVADFCRALDRDPECAKALLHRARCCSKKGEYSEAVRDYELYLDLSGKGTRAVQDVTAELERAKERERAEGTDHYAVLGVHPTAAADEIKKAYKKLALTHHPDKQVSDSAEMCARAERRFKKITFANNIISDPSSRRAYDLSRGVFTRTYSAPQPPRDTGFGGSFGRDKGFGERPHRKPY